MRGRGRKMYQSHPIHPSIHRIKKNLLKIREAISSTTQSIPSSKFSPVTALHASILQWCVAIVSSSSS